MKLVWSKNSLKEVLDRYKAKQQKGSQYVRPSARPAVSAASVSSAVQPQYMQGVYPGPQSPMLLQLLVPSQNMNSARPAAMPAAANVNSALVFPPREVSNESRILGRIEGFLLVLKMRKSITRVECCDLRMQFENLISTLSEDEKALKREEFKKIIAEIDSKRA